METQTNLDPQAGVKSMIMNMTVCEAEADRACVRTHGTVEDLLSLIPGPTSGKHKGDPFITLSGRAAKAWLALFAHARRQGTWRPRQVDPLRPELAEGQRFTLTAHWTVAGLGYAMGANRDTAGKALKELLEGGWIRREDPRNKGQFGGIDYCFAVPTTVTQADKLKVTEGLKQRGVEYRGYEFRTAARVLEDHEIELVRQDVAMDIEIEQADLAEDGERATDLASKIVLRQRMADKTPDDPAVDRPHVQSRPAISGREA
jgi:hypothetical protein